MHVPPVHAHVRVRIIHRALNRSNWRTSQHDGLAAQAGATSAALAVAAAAKRVATAAATVADLHEDDETKKAITARAELDLARQRLQAAEAAKTTADDRARAAPAVVAFVAARFRCA